MTNFRRNSIWLLTGAGVAMLAVSLVAYRQNHQRVFVTFTGPWAFAADPTDPNHVFAFAPKTTSHSDLVVQSSGTSERQTLAAGIYELSFPVAAIGYRTDTSPNVLQAKIDAQGVQHALSARLERYAIRLPKPEAFLVTSTERSRVDSTYPPAASTENDYMTTVSLRYYTGNLGELFLVGRPDEDGPFHPVLAQPPVISFSVRPLFGMAGRMDCNIHLREAFHDLSKLVNLKLYVDFPEDPPECRVNDPQKPPA